MEEMQKRRRQIAEYVILFVVSLAFYLVWYLLDGIIITEDAPSYINMQSDREPLYCLYLWLFRGIFGTERYLHAVVIVQCVIAAVAACMVTAGLTRLFSLKWFGSMGVLAVQYGITLLNRFVAQRRYSYFNSIETEGLSFSIWIFYFLCLLGILYKKDKKSVVGAVLWSMVLISIRKHMLITLVILFFVIIGSYIKKKGLIKAGIYALLACMVGFAGTKLIDCSYNLMMRGEFAPHTGDSSFILGTELYLANKEMVQYIQDDENKELFLEIMKRADEREYNVAYAGSGWQAMENHYSSAYDRIKFDIVMVVIREHQDAEGIVWAEREADYNQIAGTMMKELLLPSVPKLITLFCCNVIHGLITTVLKVHRLLNWAALFLYLFYMATIVGLFALRRRYTDTDSCHSEYFALLVLLAIIVNVCFTSLTIYCQMRYMLYNTGLFYQAWWIMLLQIAEYRKKKGNEQVIDI
ncbi:MAG: hypothetical protein K2M91_10025 [Lachnospiraceae bacterium]|nr:hypothetical protein [Lachnospiraceae bacterium]